MAKTQNTGIQNCSPILAGIGSERIALSLNATARGTRPTAAARFAGEKSAPRLLLCHPVEPEMYLVGDSSVGVPEALGEGDRRQSETRRHAADDRGQPQGIACSGPQASESGGGRREWPRTEPEIRIAHAALFAAQAIAAVSSPKGARTRLRRYGSSSQGSRRTQTRIPPWTKRSCDIRVGEVDPNCYMA